VRISGRFGDPGAGKTYPINLLLRDHLRRHPDGNDFTVIVPTDELREKTTKDLDLPQGKGFLVKTWERAFTENLAPTIILDECGLFPPVLDLLLLCRPGVRSIFFTGGPGQGEYRLHPNCPGRATLLPTLQLLSPGACCYLTENWRIASETGTDLNMVTRSTRHGGIFFNRLDHGPVVTTTAGAAAAYRGLGRDSHTMESSQGSTLHGPCSVLLDRYALDLDDSAIFTALTRGDSSVHVVEANGKPASLLMAASPIIRALGRAAVTGDCTELKSAITNHRNRHLPQQLCDPLRQPGNPPPPLTDLLYEPLLGTGFGDYIFSFLGL
jgi:hypothetical protein